MKINPLIPLGSIIKVDKYKIKNVRPKNLLDDLPQIINAEIIDYKMTDGMGIGYVLLTENKQRIWVFNNELNDLTKAEYNICETNNSSNIITKMLVSRINKIDYEISGNKKINTITNPINLISWLIFTLKDIF